jgi:hypothetical protein
MSQFPRIEEAERLLDHANWESDRSLRTAQLYRGREVAHRLHALGRSDLALRLAALADAMRPIGTSVDR